jgi:hypothetical protein
VCTMTLSYLRYVGNMKREMQDNYRSILVAVIVVGSWLCGAITSLGITAQFMDTGNPWIFLGVAGGVLTFLFVMLVVIANIYPELSKSVADKD